MEHVTMNSQQAAMDFQDDTLREQVRLAMKQLPSMQAASFIVALVLAYTVRDTAPRANVCAWILMVLLIVASRIVFYFRFRKVCDQLFGGEYWNNSYLVLAFISGIVWGLSAFAIFPAGNPGLISLFVLVIASLSAATTVSHSSIRWAPTAWAGPAMLLYAVRCAMEGGGTGYTVSALIVLYVFTILRYSLIHHGTITSAIALKFENLGLLEELRKAQGVLETRVEERTIELRRSNEYLIRAMEERRLAEDALRASEEKYRELVEQAKSIVLRWDTNGVITFVNEFAQRFFGYTEAELLGKNVLGTIVAKTSREGVDLERMIQDICRNLLAFEYNENENVCKNGERVWVSWSNQPIFSKSGELVELLSIGQDMTERKRTEEALRESEQTYRLLADNVSDVIFTMDLNLKLTYVSPSIARLHGWTPEQFVTLSPSEYLTPESLALVLEVLGDELALQTSPEADPNRVRTIEIEQVRKDGTAFWTEVTARFLYDDTGAPVGIIGVTRDITDRKRAEEALRANEERLRLAMEVTRQGWFDLNVQTGEVDVSPEYARILGYEPGEFASDLRNWIDGLHPEDRDTVLKTYQECLETGDARTMEYRRQTKTGEWRWIHSIGKVVEFDCENKPLRMAGTHADISERKQAQEEMRQLRNYLSNIIDSMPSMLVGVDAEGRVTQWNAAAERAAGITASEVLGQALVGVCPSLTDVMENVRQALLTRTVYSESRRPRLIGGETRYQDITVYPLTSQGMDGAVIRVDDVSERVKVEEMMIQSEKMLSVGGLAAGMAHEINNPLGVILQASQNVLRRVSPDLPANARIAEACGTTLGAVREYLEQREITLFLEDIRNGGLRAAQIVENMLAFSRKPDAEGSSTDLAELLDRTLLLAESDYDLKKRYDFRQIEIVREYHPDVPLVVCQASKMQQVFLNILRNGAEAMRETRDSGRAPRFVLRALREGPKVRVEIEDNGPGLDEATRRRVFEPFFTTKPPGIGTGLGLSVSYFIVTQEHMGALSVTSQPGVGSSFIVELPVEGYQHE
jgi:PAS domain S-box-containing protein